MLSARWPGPGGDPRRQQCPDIFAAKDSTEPEPVWNIISQLGAAGAGNCRDFNDHYSTIEKQLKHLLLYNLIESLYGTSNGKLVLRLYYYWLKLPPFNY